MNFNKFIDISLQQKKGVNCPTDPNFRNNIDLEDQFSPEASCQAARQQIEQEQAQANMPRPRRSDPDKELRAARIAAYKFQDANPALMQSIAADKQAELLKTANLNKVTSTNPYTPYASQIAMQRRFGGTRKRLKKSKRSKRSKRSKKSKKSMRKIK